MRKLFILILAGCLSALGFSSCHSSRKAADGDNYPIENQDKPERDFREMICLYGVPNAVYKKNDDKN